MNAVEIAVNEALINTALGAISLFTTYALYAAHKLTQKAKVQINQIQDETARRKLENAISDVETLASVTVACIEQTTAKVLREEVKKGKADASELEALAVNAKKKIMSAIKPEARRIISDNLGSFDDYVAKLIEQRVLELKTAMGRQVS